VELAEVPSRVALLLRNEHDRRKTKFRSVAREPKAIVDFASGRPNSRVGPENQTRRSVRGELGPRILAKIKHAPSNRTTSRS
jgi:hypothetical protein